MHLSLSPSLSLSLTHTHTPSLSLSHTHARTHIYHTELLQRRDVSITDIGSALELTRGARYVITESWQSGRLINCNGGAGGDNGVIVSMTDVHEDLSDTALSITLLP